MGISPHEGSASAIGHTRRSNSLKAVGDFRLVKGFEPLRRRDTDGEHEFPKPAAFEFNSGNRHALRPLFSFHGSAAGRYRHDPIELVGSRDKGNSRENL